MRRTAGLVVFALLLIGCGGSGTGAKGGSGGSSAGTAGATAGSAGNAGHGGGGNAAAGSGGGHAGAGGGAAASLTLTGVLTGGTYSGGPISSLAASGGPLPGYQISCVTFATPPVAGTATADSTGTFTLTFNAAGVPFGCFILDPAGNSIATLVFTSGTLNSLTVSFSQNGGLGTIIVDGTSGLAQAILTSGGTLVTSAPSGTCPLGTWIANIGDVGCSTPLIATIWIAQSPTGQYLVSSYSGPEGHLNCAYQGGGAIPATYANGVLSFIGGSINSCNVTSMVTLTPDAQCQTATISMTQVCGTCDGGSQCCGPQTCTTNLTAQRQGTGRADAGVDRGTDASLGCPQPASGAACNSVPVFGMVTPTCSTAAAPTPQGGTLADGTYVLQSLTTYSPAQYCDIGPNIQETVAISGSCEQATFIQTPTSASSPSFVQNLTIQADAGVINGTVTCPTGTSSLANKIPYTAGPGGQLTFFGPNTNGSCDGGQCPGTSVFVLQKQ